MLNADLSKADRERKGRYVKDSPMTDHYAERAENPAAVERTSAALTLEPKE